MKYWQIWRLFAGWWNPTTEFVYAPDYLSALKGFQIAVDRKSSGFGPVGEYDCKPVNGFPGTIRGCATRLVYGGISDGMNG